MSAKYPIIDGHNDVLLEICYPENGIPRDFFAQNESGHLDLPRAKQGGFAGGFFAIYTPSKAYLDNPQVESKVTRSGDSWEVAMEEPLDLPYAQQVTLKMFAQALALCRKSEGQVSVATSVPLLQQCLKNNQLAMILHIEGADCLDTDLDMLHVLYEAGLRSLGIVWSRPNAFGHGVPFKYPSTPDTGPGLTDAGKALVKCCNELGVMIDLSHLNEAGFWDVQKLSTAPLVATHSCVNAISATARNLTDKQIDAIGESGGVIGINFHSCDIRADGKKTTETPLTEFVKHFDYIAERIGVEHLAFGSDFDGATMPDEVSDVSKLPNLLSTLGSAGFNEAALNAMAHGNWLRVLQNTWM